MTVDPPAGSAHCLAALVLLALAVPETLRAQEEPTDCVVLCRPTLTAEPGVAVEPLFRSPRVAELRDGVVADTVREATSAAFEVTLAVTIPTEIPRTELGVDVTWTPFARTESNPFTGRSAEGTEASAFRDNAIEFAPQASVTLVDAERTAGWSELALTIADNISPAQTPGAGSVFTHKLSFAADWTIAVLRFLPEESWPRHLALEGSLDFLATGVPEAGAEVPRGEQRFLDDGSRWGLSVVAIAPLAPLSP